MYPLALIDLKSSEHPGSTIEFDYRNKSIVTAIHHANLATLSLPYIYIVVIPLAFCCRFNAQSFYSDETRIGLILWIFGLLPSGYKVLCLEICLLIGFIEITVNIQV